MVALNLGTYSRFFRIVVDTWESSLGADGFRGTFIVEHYISCLSVVYELNKDDLFVWNIKCGTFRAQGCAWLKDCNTACEDRINRPARKGVPGDIRAG